MRKDRHYSKRQLEKYIKKMGETLMIGAISSIENEFGHLWGHNKNEDYTPEEEAMFEKWENLRQDILNKGNRNIVYMIDLLDNFKINMYKAENTFQIRKKTDER